MHNILESIGMNYLVLALIVVGCSVQQIAKKSYNVRNVGGVYIFSAATTFMAMLFFAATSGVTFEFSAEAIWYSIAFASAYSVATVFSMLAIKTGPLALTSLIVSYSLIIPTVYGLVVLDETMNIWLGVGMFLLLASLFLINMENKSEEKQITLQWSVYVFLSFIGNGACSTIQKVQQISFDGRYKNEFMIIALLIAAIVLLAFAGVTEKKETIKSLKKGFGFYTICGLSNGLVNYLVLVLSNKMPASVMFPVISAGGVVLAALVSVSIYKEKLSPQQWLGATLGTLAIIALS